MQRLHSFDTAAPGGAEARPATTRAQLSGSVLRQVYPLEADSTAANYITQNSGSLEAVASR